MGKRKLEKQAARQSELWKAIFKVISFRASQILSRKVKNMLATHL